MMSSRGVVMVSALGCYFADLQSVWESRIQR